MKKFLFSDLYREIKVIGFDLDGTLYDEFDFIKQVYEEIISRLNLGYEIRPRVLSFMLSRWLEHGSSYPFIFKETQQQFQLKTDFEKFSLDIFRNYIPQLKLSERVKFILNKMKDDQKELFLLTDGKEVLQNRKIKALGLDAYFKAIFITDDRPKPDLCHREKIIKMFLCNPTDIVYIGDREIDREFANNCDFHYIPHINLI